MNTLQCNLCHSKIYPYCPNPDEIMWMCENEDCLFPFSEDPEQLKEVCSLRPKISSDSLTKQVQLLQDDKLDREISGQTSPTLVENIQVQDDILESMCKIQQFLTNYQQKGDADFAYNSIDLSGHMEIDQLDQLLNSDNFDETQQLEFSVDSEPIFRVEKVCRPSFSNLLSYTDLDSASDRVSAWASDDGITSELAEDAEMEVEQNSFTLNELTYGQSALDAKAAPNCVGSTPTYSCTHSYVG